MGPERRPTGVSCCRRKELRAGKRRRCQSGLPGTGDPSWPGHRRGSNSTRTDRTGQAFADLRGLSGDRSLEVELERGDRARGVAEGRGKVAQGERIGRAAGFTRRCGNHVKAGADVGGEGPPTGQPATGRAQGHGKTGCLPRRVESRRRGGQSQQVEKLDGPQRAVRNDCLPVDRECSPAPYMRVTVGTKKRSARVSCPWPVSGWPRR